MIAVLHLHAVRRELDTAVGIQARGKLIHERGCIDAVETIVVFAVITSKRIALRVQNRGSVRADVGEHHLLLVRAQGGVVVIDGLFVLDVIALAEGGLLAFAHIDERLHLCDIFYRLQGCHHGGVALIRLYIFEHVDIIRQLTTGRTGRTGHNGIVLRSASRKCHAAHQGCNDEQIEFSHT